MLFGLADVLTDLEHAKAIVSAVEQVLGEVSD